MQWIGVQMGKKSAVEEKTKLLGYGGIEPNENCISHYPAYQVVERQGAFQPSLIRSK